MTGWPVHSAASALGHRYGNSSAGPHDNQGHDVFVYLTLSKRTDGFSDQTGFNEQWWRPRISQRGSTLFFVSDERGVEVARVEMVERTHPGEYLGDVDPRRFVKIQFIEVHQRHRGRGVGLVKLRLIAERYPDRRLLAFSESDAFWDKTGWTRYIHAEDDVARPRHQALYLQPE